MESLRELFKIGHGPSSSHTIGPENAVKRFLKEAKDVNEVNVTLYGSLAATGKGHLTDWIIKKTFDEIKTNIIWKYDVFLEKHPNAMKIESLDRKGNVILEKIYYSVGGGTVLEEGETISTTQVYRFTTLTDINEYCKENGIELWQYIEEEEGKEIWPFLEMILDKMYEIINIGIYKEGPIPGKLKIPRKAHSFYQKSKSLNADLAEKSLITAYALAVSEENASGGVVVTAPTCGACGVLPSVLRYLQESYNLTKDEVIKALAIAGLFGNLIKYNASISGAEVGCQGEVGSACSMAAAASAKLLGGSLNQIEYAAEVAMEHHLGLTCDPIGGYVQIPCIERNAIAASRAIEASKYAFISDGSHRISYDEVIKIMKETGKDLKNEYKETSLGGLAKLKK